MMYLLYQLLPPELSTTNLLREREYNYKYKLFREFFVVHCLLKF